MAINDRKLKHSTVSVAVLCMCSVEHLARCLAALRSQRDAPDFEVVVVCAPEITGGAAACQQFPEVRIVVNERQRTPLELASRALRECKGDLILLTKDHCVPCPDWVRTMVEAQGEGRAVVGGRVEIARGASRTDWAFYFIDFFRYAAPVAPGPAPSLTVCNVAYKRAELEAVRSLWEETFLESVINDALRERYGTLWLHPASEVTMTRRVSLRDAIYERYAYGRVFGCARLAACSSSRRLFYALFAPALPLLLLGRMAAVALRSRRHAQAFAQSLAPLMLMVLSRSWGEWLAYLTGRFPRSMRGVSLAERRPRHGI